jgi:hypothetical protein
MNKGVELLIARMKSNPEEFKPNEYVVGGGVNGTSKWENLLHNWRHCLTEEELKAFQEALRETHRELFHQEVMKHLFRVSEMQQEEYMTFNAGSRMVYNHPYNEVQPSTGLWNASAINVGQQTLDEETVEYMKAHLKNLKAAGKL